MCLLLFVVRSKESRVALNGVSESPALVQLGGGVFFERILRDYYIALGEGCWVFRGEEGAHETGTNIMFPGSLTVRRGTRTRTFCLRPPHNCGVSPVT